MLASGLIEPCESEWASLIVMVSRQDNSFRFCLDYRELNDVTRKDAYPLPKIVAILDRLSRNRFISTIDLSQAYH